MDLLNIIFGGGHFEIQYGRRAKCILLNSSSLPVRKVYDFNPNIHGWKRPNGRPKTRWADSITHDIHSVGLNNIDAAQMVFDRPQWKAFVCGLPTSNPSKALKLSKSSPQWSEIEIYFLWLHLRYVFWVEETDRSTYKLFYSGHLKFKMATILDLNWSISPQRA